jgi:hypothetical protein
MAAVLIHRSGSSFHVGGSPTPLDTSWPMPMSRGLDQLLTNRVRYIPKRSEIATDRIGDAAY